MKPTVGFGLGLGLGFALMTGVAIAQEGAPPPQQTSELDAKNALLVQLYQQRDYWANRAQQDEQRLVKMGEELATAQKAKAKPEAEPKVEPKVIDLPKKIPAPLPPAPTAAPIK